jgi:alcohol dehydrogenase
LTAFKQSCVYLRTGALHELGPILQTLNRRRVFFVVDEVAVASSGMEELLRLSFQGSDLSRFVGFEPNPKLLDIERGIKQFNGFSSDLVVAFGGGTAIDLGKLIGLLARQPNPARNVVTGESMIEFDATPMIAIPTTAGTGSEATHFAVVYVDGRKYSVVHPSLIPNYAIVDPQLTFSLPPAVTAATGLDAFCQSIESMWAVGATDDSIVFAREAILYAWKYLAQAVLSPTPESRLGMCKASHLAGKAINISKTTAPHALSYAITSEFKIPHGMAVAMTLSAMMEFNALVTHSDCVDPRGPEHVRKRILQIVELLGAPSIEEACLRINKFIESLGCPSCVTQAGISDEASLQRIVDSVNAVRMSNNPRRATKQSLLELLRGNCR